MSQKVYEVLTRQILDRLESGTVPWRQPWRDRGSPRNAVSKRPYRGFNRLVLSMAGWSSPLWLTAKQIEQLGGNIQPNQRPVAIAWWKWPEAEVEEEGEAGPRQHPWVRYYRVWNRNQCDGLDLPQDDEPADFDPIEACDSLVLSYRDRPAIDEGRAQPSYNPRTDRINMPEPTLFHDPEGFYAVLFHELTHSTGHASRLARPEIVESNRFGSDPYSAEELVAELGAAFLCGIAGISPATLDQSATYIDGWRKVLGDDPRIIVFAAQRAQKAVDYMVGEQDSASTAEAA